MASERATSRVMLRIGIIGAARVATYAMIAPARANPRTQVAAVAARDPERARAYAAQHGIPKVAESYAALCADPAIDLIYVATPPRFHLEHALLALAAGKPVLVEKPFAMNAAEASTLLAAARDAGLPAFEAMHSRHHPLLDEVRLRLGSIGEVVSIEANFDIDLRDRPDDFRWDAGLGGGALMDLGIYPLAWARHITSAEPAVLRVEADRMPGRSADAETRAELRLGRVRASIRASMVRPRGASLVVHGERGRIEVDNPLAPQLGASLRLTDAAVTRDLAVPPGDTYALQLKAVAGTLLDGAPFPLAADDPLRSMTAIDAVRDAVGITS